MTQDAPKEPVDSISDDVAKAISEVEETDTETVEETTEETTETTTEAAEESQEETTEEAAEEVELNVPEHWSEQDKTEFSGIKDRKSALSFVERRYREMEAGTTKKFQEIASIRKKGEALEEVLSIHRQDYNLQGMDDVAAVRQLFTIYSNLKSSPAQTIQWLAQQYGVNIQQEEGPQTDPAIQQLSRQIQQLHQSQTQSAQQLHLRQQQELLSQIDSFKSLKDEQGNPKHPHFEEVRSMMGQLIQSGLATNMDDAYAKAVTLRTDLKPMVTVKKQDLEKAAAAAKAKKAASGVKSAGTAVKTQAPQNKTLREDILAVIGDNDIRI